MTDKKIVVFGASGRVGSLIVKRLLENECSVTAFVHGEPNLPKDPKLTVVRGDVHNSDDIMKALKGAKVIVSALGSWGTPSKDILTSAMQNIIPAMKANGISRIISLTGADARASGDTLSVIHRLSHPALSIIAGKILRDSEGHIKLLEASGLDWTVIRSPIMTNGAAADYTLTSTRPLPWAKISRRAVVGAMVDQVESSKEIRTAPFVA